MYVSFFYYFWKSKLREVMTKTAEISFECGVQCARLSTVSGV